MIDALCNMEDAAQAATGMERVYLTLKAKNYLYCYTSDGRDLWRMVNRHLWRLRAMYEGGDCFLAHFPGALPHQPLWRYQQPAAPAHRRAQSPLLPFILAEREKQRRLRFAAYRARTEDRG